MPQGALQAIARMIGRIEERVDLRDAHSLLRLSRLHDLVAGTDLAFLAGREGRSPGRPLPVSSAGMRGSFIRMPTR